MYLDENFRCISLFEQLVYNQCTQNVCETGSVVCVRLWVSWLFRVL